MANQYTKAREAAQEQAAPIQEVQKPVSDMSREERQNAAGIPDSKVFASGEANPAVSLVLNCHIQGIPVRDLPVHHQHAIRFEHTDEGIAEHNRIVDKLRAEGRLATITMESDRETEVKRFGKMRDDLLDGASYDEVTDPMRVQMEKHLKPGEDGRWMDPETVDHLGDRGFEQRMDKDGKPIKLGQMYLGVRSKEAAAESERRKEAKSRLKLQAIQEQINEQQSRLAHAVRAAGGGDAVAAGPAPHKPGLRITQDIGDVRANRR